MNVPLLYLVFNRPLHTEKSFSALRKIKPKFLFIGADGPRQENKSDEKNCADVRKIVQAIDWDCQVKTLFREHNLGTKIAVSSAIDWFFSQAEEGIILEDDCVPHPDFYTYVAAMLERYRSNERIMHVNGTNLLRGRKIVKTGSYYFSDFCHPWGWATWKRAWEKNDIWMKDFPAYTKETLLHELKDDPQVADYWWQNLFNAHLGRTKSWDYQWYFAFWKNNGMAITPAMNLVTNIGFDEMGTNTFSRFNRFSKMKTYAMDKIVEPEQFRVNKEADQFANLQRAKEMQPTLLKKIRFKFDLILKELTQRGNIFLN
jgi:hypothetical protein